MHLEVIDSHLRSRRVHFAWTVQTPDARVIHVFDVFLGFVFVERHRLIGGGANSRVAHCAFEFVVRVILLEALES